MNPLESIAIILITFVIAGTVKGIIGLGLPSVSLGILTLAFDLPTAMALMVAPSLVTNIWQACTGGHGKALLLRLWPFFALATVMVGVGGLLFPHVDLQILSGLLGILLVAYSAASLSGFKLKPDARHGLPGQLVCGAVNGLLTGLTGSFVVPGVMYLQAIELHRDALIQAMGILFTVSTLALALTLQSNAILTAELSVQSMLGIPTAIGGMMLGQKIRRSITEATFRKVFFYAILILGTYIFISAVS